MSNLEHLIENAIESVENGNSFENWRDWEQQIGNYVNADYIKSTPEEIWEIANYVVYTHDMCK